MQSIYHFVRVAQFLLESCTFGVHQKKIIKNCKYSIECNFEEFFKVMILFQQPVLLKDVKSGQVFWYFEYKVTNLWCINFCMLYEHFQGAKEALNRTNQNQCCINIVNCYMLVS